ncbi:thermonuclease family protein [Reyranella sp.]|uniref:thermonuclease family protein n=1 Tax=Reyranella sp. TaxID=1929291 RepID=UPI003D14E455
MWRPGLLAILLAFPASAQTDNDTVVPSARPRFQVVDGGTVRFGPQPVRLMGIAAPDKGQTCDDGQWHPAPLAKKALETFIAGRAVSCRQVDQDESGRPIGQCHAGADDLQAMMVSAGWAWSFGTYGNLYEPEERDAARRRVGVHGHHCLRPWEWRAKQRARNTQ